MVKVKLLTCATDRPDVTGGENCGRQASRREFPGNTGIFRTGTLEKPQPVDFPDLGPRRNHNRWIFQYGTLENPQPVDFPDLGPRRNHNRWIFRTGASENPQKVVFPTESIGETTKGGFSNPESRQPRKPGTRPQNKISNKLKNKTQNKQVKGALK